MEVDRGYKPNAHLAWSPPVPVDRTHTTARKEDGTRDRLLMTAGIGRRGLSGYDDLVRKRALVGDSQDEEERSDDLFHRK